MTIRKVPGRSLESQIPTTTRQGCYNLMGQVEFPLRLEIAKEYDPSAIRFLVNGIREFPRSFAKTQKTLFIHPDANMPEPPAPLRDIYWLCKLQLQAEGAKRSQVLCPLLRRKLAEYTRHLSHALGIEDLLGYSQALILIQCILALGEDDSNEYFEGTSVLLESVAERLWQQAPIQLPSSLSPRHAWLLAESVRRTIIVSLMLRSAYSLHTRNYSVRTPFVDALPFDVHTELWDDGSQQTWAKAGPGSHGEMMSLHEYSDALESGRVYDVSPFAALVLAACKGKEVSAITFPPPSSYIHGS